MAFPSLYPEQIEMLLHGVLARELVAKLCFAKLEDARQKGIFSLSGAAVLEGGCRLRGKAQAIQL